jgi:cation:H+ antiporter
MEWLLDPGLALSFLMLAGCALIICLAGVRLAGVVDELADRTGLGEAMAGALLLGMATSLSGIVLSVTAAYRGQPELAMSNAVGGIAVQTLFLTVADMCVRRVNLEHAAASLGNLLQGALLLCLLAIILVGSFSPNVTIWSIHPATFVLFGGYLYGLRVIRSGQADAMWQPTRTAETREDRPDDEPTDKTLVALWCWFVILAGVLGLSGWVLHHAATAIAQQTAIGEAAVGVLLTATVTSLPELVTGVAAARRGALTLAVGGIIGGNAFDTLFAAASDVAYREGSIYHAISDSVMLWISLAIVMTGVLIMGLIRREKEGLGKIGFESVALILIYAAGVGMVLVRDLP